MMPNTGADLQNSHPAIQGFFNDARAHVYTEAALTAIVAANRSAWGVGRVPVPAIVDFLLQEGGLRLVELTNDTYLPVRRFTWGASPFDLALSLRANSYLSHGTAAHLLGLFREAPTTLHVNKEQSPKPASGELTQEGIDRAFAARPRESRLVYADRDGHRYVIIAGKCTGRLGVERIAGPGGTRLPMTGLERTLIDMTVRPIYAGGVHRVLEAYRAARERASPKRLIAVLKKMGHLYPYHQAVGFYLERAGFKGPALDLARAVGLEFDFYLTHAMGSYRYDRSWRIHYPTDL